MEIAACSLKTRPYALILRRSVPAPRQDQTICTSELEELSLAPIQEMPVQKAPPSTSVRLTANGWPRAGSNRMFFEGHVTFRRFHRIAEQ